MTYRSVFLPILLLGLAGSGVVQAKETVPQKFALPTASTAMTLRFSERQWRDLVFDVAHNNRFDILKSLSGQALDFRMRDETGYTLLMVAAGYTGTEKGSFNPEMIDYLIAHGAEPCARTDKGNTALMVAAGSDNVPAIERLAKAGCAIDEANMSGKTALIYAASGGQDGAVRKLLSLGADPLIKGKTGYTARSYALYGQHENIAAILEEAEKKYSLKK
ncbi:ankyrin repeat domain-containing protein [Acetobacteraceae bacterium ESL0709]|nr:ankyrin repeat domain-containing protein [Acetobacteraceae bacterium ESL0697]MDF7678886.1 ankyrin repeat domain-containing protein [Acetobacteraceae bacterium ESL0709]